MIGHDPHELAAFLSAVLQGYTQQSAQAELARVFAAQYQLTLTEEVEIRYRTETSTDPETGEDVYKRQGTAKFFTLLLLLYRTLAKSQGMKQLMAGAGVAVVGMVLVPLLSGPVSYTHLDVYKRQALRCREAHSRVRQDWRQSQPDCPHPQRCLLYTSRCV